MKLVKKMSILINDVYYKGETENEHYNFGYR